MTRAEARAAVEDEDHAGGRHPGVPEGARSTNPMSLRSPAKSMMLESSSCGGGA